jgi:hypothetical protein
VTKSEIGNNNEEKKWLINEIQYLAQLMSDKVQTDKQRCVDLAKGFRTSHEQTQKAIIAAAAFIATLLITLPPSGLIDLSTTQKSWTAVLFILDLVFGLAMYYLSAFYTRKGYMLLMNLSSSYDKPLHAIDKMKDYTVSISFWLDSLPIDRLFSLCNIRSYSVTGESR